MNVQRRKIQARYNQLNIFFGVNYENGCSAHDVLKVPIDKRLKSEIN